MKNITFGKLLEKLLYLSNQKKSSLAKVLGYDVSYISKWITGKNLPTQKSISDVCKITSEFIVSSLNISHIQELKDYFEIDEDLESNSVLVQYLEQSLKEAYMYTAEKSLPNLYKKTHYEDSYNSMTQINPRLRKQYLSKDVNLFMSNSDKVDLIISADLYKLNNQKEVFLKNIEQTEILIEQVKSREKEGMALQSDITRHELRLQNLKLALIELNNTYNIINYQLVQTLALPENTVIQPVTSVLDTDFSLVEENNLMNMALENRSELKIASKLLPIMKLILFFS